MSGLLDDVEPAQAVDDVYQPTVIHCYVIGADPVATRLRVGVEMADFSRCVRIGNIEHPDPLREPRERYHRSGDNFARLVASGEASAGAPLAPKVWRCPSRASHWRGSGRPLSGRPGHKRGPGLASQG